MRICDWSSDVCSSDLGQVVDLGGGRVDRRHRGQAAHPVPADLDVLDPDAGQPEPDLGGRGAAQQLVGGGVAGRLVPQHREAEIARPEALGLLVDRLARPPPPAGVHERPVRRIRSEEHTSELQSLMRISYAVFFLTKKKTNYT